MQKQEGLTNEIREKEDKLLAITEQKQQAEDRAAKLDADLTKEREMYHALMQSFDAKKEEHLREQRQKTSLETSERELKQKILNKDAQLKTSEELAKSYKATIESLEAAKTDLNEQITDLDKKNRMEIAKYESLKKEHEQTKREKDKREKELDTLKSDHIDLKGKNHLLKNDNQRFARLNSDLNSQNKRLEDSKF
jgi:chromosome segregation ATPase